MFVTIPFVTNLLGRNIYVYINLGSHDLVFAAANCVSHNAISEHIEMDDVSLGGMISIEEYVSTIVEVGPLHIFAEPNGGELSPFTFRWIEPDKYTDYHGIEFPWLLLLLIPLGLIAWPSSSSS